MHMHFPLSFPLPPPLSRYGVCTPYITRLPRHLLGTITQYATPPHPSCKTPHPHHHHDRTIFLSIIYYVIHWKKTKTFLVFPAETYPPVGQKSWFQKQGSVLRVYVGMWSQWLSQARPGCDACKIHTRYVRCAWDITRKILHNDATKRRGVGMI